MWTIVEKGEEPMGSGLAKISRLWTLANTAAMPHLLPPDEADGDHRDGECYAAVNQRGVHPAASSPGQGEHSRRDNGDDQKRHTGAGRGKVFEY